MKTKQKFICWWNSVLLLLLLLTASSAFADTVLDNFESASYGNNDGTVSWASNWIEINESDGPSSGDERVNDGRLRIQDNDGGGEGVERAVNLSGATAATLSFEYRRNALDDSNDYVVVPEKV
jgi:opacity protein-like surface antigen